MIENSFANRSSDQISVNLQQVFWGRPEFLPSAEDFPAGMTSAEAFIKIFQGNGDIQRISYSTFNPNDSSATVLDQAKRVIWIDGNGSSVDSLRAISSEIAATTRRPSFIASSDTNFDTQVEHDALALDSLVILKNGRKAHIPMLDFDIPISRFSEDAIITSVYPRKGVLLETDMSYHFIGFNVLNITEWRDFMSRCIDHEFFNKGKLFDLGYLVESLERKFAALRLFGYPGTKKKTEPTVVRVIT